MPQQFPSYLVTDAGVRRDWVDLRDQTYVPSLSILREAVSIDKLMAPADPSTGLRAPLFGVRNQGDTGRCVGYALANLVDIQRNLQRSNGFATATISEIPHNIVSADMLYRMAYFHDRYPDLEEQISGQAEGVRTLRSAIKGFYHHGACLDWPDASPPTDLCRWQSTCYNGESVDRERPYPSVEQAKSAREIGLGAYFRLASILNHFHAALNDAGAVLVTANIHDGWLQTKPAIDGKIPWPPAKGKVGSHAFVLTGYDENGFHVLNSWGPDWGGYRTEAEAANGEPGRAGIGLWSYEDWAQNVIDGWVLRLGVRAPKAFGVSIGERGTKGQTSSIQAGSTPGYELVGHYMHLDDGFHVSTGSYPSFESSWGNTRKYLRENFEKSDKSAEDKKTAYRGMLIWIPGSLEGIKPAFASAVQRKAQIKALGLYPYSIFWCNNFVEKSLEVLEIIFESCREQAGKDAAHLDNLIEQRVQGVGRAFWRDIEMSARRAIRGTGELPHEPEETDSPTRLKPGYVAEFLADIIQLKADTGCELHLVAEGAGALVLHEMLSIADEYAKSKRRKRHPFGKSNCRDLFDTVHLVHPAIGMPRAQRQILKMVDVMNGTIAGSRKPPGRKETTPTVKALVGENYANPKARIYIPTPELEKAVHFGSYSKSILHLVSRSFEDRYPAPRNASGDLLPHLSEPRQFLGMAEIATDKDFPAQGSIFRLNMLESQVSPSDPVSQTDFNNDPTITNAIFKSIQEIRDRKK